MQFVFVFAHFSIHYGYKEVWPHVIWKKWSWLSAFDFKALGTQKYIRDIRLSDSHNQDFGTLQVLQLSLSSDEDTQVVLQ
jgi:hypothetical protein